ncbi:pyridoxal phosphate-dependent aminotransferase [Hymenobacter psychrotolerans]|uniref:Aspartate aminotransferase n=1 Tax=Hymenobacter psychrotolerans DSM 18569 TaxID=1121959 RepID=A0A1M6XK56_9BACT|nr:aminotransferase class I/II-fold pyridoxal phosphate-dependent enzyme [Hymenobacter psychrotolerans]SHL06380.1 aspartate aminotransferase [Hymenobacter psychrotolerans DSM 18569]
MTPISLASGYGSFPAPAVVAPAVARQLPRAPWPASPTEGLAELRAALASRYLPHLPASGGADAFLVTPGTKAALFLALSSVLQSGDEVVLLTPNWFGFAELVRRAGGHLRELPLSPADNYALPLDAIAAALTPRTRVLLFSNPNNPTGRIYTPPELKALLALTRRFPALFVLADEIYDGILFGPESVPSLLSFPDPGHRHLVVNGFSKSHALVGWNIGWLAAPQAVRRASAARLFATGGAVAVPSQLAALAVLQDGNIGVDLCRQLLPNRQRLLGFLATLPGALPHPPLGTYYAFPDLRAFLTPNLPLPEASADLVARLLAAGVEVVDGATCGAPGFVRMSYAVPEPDLQEAVRRLGAVLR